MGYEDVNRMQLTHATVRGSFMANIQKPFGFVKNEDFATG
jgi:hypothetical protein